MQKKNGLSSRAGRGERCSCRLGPAGGVTCGAGAIGLHRARGKGPTASRKKNECRSLSVGGRDGGPGASAARIKPKAPLQKKPERNQVGGRYWGGGRVVSDRGGGVVHTVQIRRDRNSIEELLGEGKRSLARPTYSRPEHSGEFAPRRDRKGGGTLAGGIRRFSGEQGRGKTFLSVSTSFSGCHLNEMRQPAKKEARKLALP